MASRAPIRFSFGLRWIDAQDGETLLEALSRRGLPRVVRSVRYHRPRSPYCGIGHCTGCLVRVNGRPNVRACRLLPHEGDRVECENAWPGPRFDLLGSVDVVFPHGLDTLHGFRRPAWAAGVYQRVVRRLAGYGAPPDANAAAGLAAAPDVRDIDTVVVGAGRAGLTAAAVLRREGTETLVVDRDLARPDVADAGAIVRGSVTFLPPPAPTRYRPFTLLGFEEPGRGLRIHARRVVVATGGYDGPLLFGGNDRPGVVAADLLFALRDPASIPFGRAVVVGGGSRAREAVERLGSRCAAVVAIGGIRPELVRAASERHVPLYPRTLLLRAKGRSRVRALELRPRAGGMPFVLPCDGVVLAHRRLPNAQLLFQVGAAMAWRPEPGAYFPVAGPDGATSVPGVFVVGSVAGPASSPGPSGAGAPGSVVRGPDAAAGGELARYYGELLREPRHGKSIACPCEDVLLDELLEAHHAGYRGLEVVKRRTGIGTGLCQGRYCLPDALLLLSGLEGRPPPEVGFVTQRPPLVPTPLGALASLPAEPEEGPIP